MIHFHPYKLFVCLALILCIGCGPSAEKPSASSVDSPDTEEISNDDADLNSISEEEYEEQFGQARDLMNRGLHQQAFDILIGIENAGAAEHIELRATVEICNAYTLQGKEKLASFKRNACVSKLKALCSEITDPRYDVLLAEAYAGKPDLDAAIQILNNAKSRYPVDDSLRMLAEHSSRIYFEAAAKIKSIDDEQDFKNKLDYLCLSLSYDESNKDAQFYLLSDYIFPQLNQDQQTWIADAALGGAYPAGVRVAIGVRAAIRKDFRTADKNFRTASNANQDIGMMVEGLAYYSICSRTVPDDRMVEMVEMAVDIFPNTPQLKRTRGTLNMFQKNFEDAAADFKSYIDDSSSDEFCIWSRRLMAEAYRKTGNADAAELADMRIKKMMNSLSSKDKQVAESILRKVDVDVQKFFN